MFALSNEAFASQLLKKIKSLGSISLEDYIAQCAKHYYNKADPFGTKGDFTTAPEISQMFGELIGLFFSQYWQQNKKNSILVELGGGRGTLMSDLWRAAKVIDGFVNSNEICFVEQSELLKNKQRENMPNAHFVESFDDIPKQKPLFLIANEFFDALPICQFVSTNEGWKERLVTVKNNKLGFKLSNKITEMPKAPLGTIAETCPSGENIVKQIASHIAKWGGVGVIIDYGTDKEDYFGDSLQAISHHKFHPIFENPGAADLTAHVRFGRLASIANAANCEVPKIQTQKNFLEGLGIKKRAEMLANNADVKEQQNIAAALKRLTAPSQMGELFKVMLILPK